MTRDLGGLDPDMLTVEGPDYETWGLTTTRTDWTTTASAQYPPPVSAGVVVWVALAVAVAVALLCFALVAR